MILPLDQQVAPLALCRRLKELGAPQEALYHWSIGERTEIVAAAIFVGPVPDEELPGILGLRGSLDFAPDGIPEFVAAYTDAELGALLPRHVLELGRGVWDAEARGYVDTRTVQHSTAAQALATLLIALAERGVVKFETPAGPGRRNPGAGSPGA